MVLGQTIQCVSWLGQQPSTIFGGIGMKEVTMERVISEEEMLKSIMGGSKNKDENFHSESCLLLLMDKFLILF